MTQEFENERPHHGDVMHMIVVGCGRVGVSLARELDAAGHDVVVIDRRPETFRRLGSGFGGRTLVGVGFDRDVLREAGITADSSVMAVTSGDNSNILIARVAREMFGVERVVARIYDPQRAAIYERLGIPTVASVAWASGRILRMVQPSSPDVDWIDATSTHVMVERVIPAITAGVSIAAIESAGSKIVLLTRDGKATLPSAGALLQEGDRIQVVATLDGVVGVDHLIEHGGSH